MQPEVTLRRQIFEKFGEYLGKAWKSYKAENGGFEVVCQSVFNGAQERSSHVYFRTEVFSSVIPYRHSPGKTRTKVLSWSQGDGLKALGPQLGTGGWGAVTLPSSQVLLGLGGYSRPALTRPHFLPHLGPDSLPL